MTGVQTCALPISTHTSSAGRPPRGVVVRPASAPLPKQVLHEQTGGCMSSPAAARYLAVASSAPAPAPCLERPRFSGLGEQQGQRGQSHGHLRRSSISASGLPACSVRDVPRWDGLSRAGAVWTFYNGPILPEANRQVSVKDVAKDQCQCKQGHGKGGELDNHWRKLFNSLHHWRRRNRITTFS